MHIQIVRHRNLYLLEKTKRENSLSVGIKYRGRRSLRFEIGTFEAVPLGELGNAEDKLDGSLISQLIIAGDSIMPIQNLRAEMDLKNFVTTNNYGSKNISKYNVESFKKLDEFLTDILVSLPVAVMPGKNDPAEICLPQQPLHRSLFKTTRHFSMGID